MEKQMYLNDQNHPLTAIPDTGTLLENLVGAFLILLISLFALRILFLPEIVRTLGSAMISNRLSEWLIVLGGLALVLILLAFPIFLVFQGLLSYRNASDLDRRGILTSASVIDLWMESTSIGARYYVYYKYLENMNAVQTVTNKFFAKLARGQNIKIQMLEHIPHVSRICREHEYAFDFRDK